ncbi:MAG: vWA domain-containing protein, partial [Haliangium ochraceum]
MVRWAGLGVAVPALWACTSRTLEPGIINPTANLTAKVTQKINNNIDILFMIDNSSSMTSMQQKLLMQLPAFMQVLQMLPNGLPNVHIAVVSSDMGAPGDSTSSIACTQYGDDGNFQAMPRG